MYRFFALLWPSGSSEGARAHALAAEIRSSSSAWRVALEAPGIVVLDGSDHTEVWRTYTLPGGQGVVLGRLFRAEADGGSAQNASVSIQDDSEDIVKTQGETLGRRYWGRYVAFVRTREATCVLRDPTGGMPCYHYESGLLRIVFSDIEDCRRWVAKLSDINWQHVNGFLRFTRIVGAATGIQGVESLQAGERLTLHDRRVRRNFFWHPVKVYQSRSLEDPVEAAEVLRQSVERSVRQWQSCYRKVILELSGGLDSAVVLACMDPSDVLALNLYTDSPAGDERAYARDAARQAACEIVEAPFRCREKSLERMLSAAAPPSPVSITLASEAEDDREQLARSRGVAAIFSGQGGDNLFQRRRNGLICAEYVHRHGLGPRFARVLENTVRLTGKPVWSVLSDSLRHGLFRRPHDPYSPFRPASFLAPSAVHADPMDLIRHPWVDQATQLPCSKKQQIFDLVDTQLYFAFPCNYADLIHPLISQPVLECALQTPTYVLTHDGRERGLARTAFADVVPKAIINRVSKGAFEGYFQALLTRNLSFLRPFLLEGRLVREGAVVRDSLEQALSEQNLLRGFQLQTLIATIQAETWLTNTLTPRKQKAA